MKKLLIALLLLVLVFTASCTKKEPDPDMQNDTDTEKTEEVISETEEKNDDEALPEQPSDETKQNEEHYTVKFSDGRKVTLGDEADAALASLGDYSDFVEAPSCIHEGFDRVYSFRGFSVTTSPDADGTDRITEVGIATEECVLDSGLTIGSTFDEMEATFGDEFTDTFGFITYNVGNTQISLVSEAGIIRSILFSEVGR